VLIHELPQPQFGATHLIEGQWRINREAKTITVELQPGTLQDGVFTPHPRIGWTGSRIGPDRWADYVTYCETWDAAGRPRATAPLSCALEYMMLVEAGVRPLPETETETETENNEEELSGEDLEG
jgi:hypothetical protein